jgi:hypothetical protein
MVGDLGGGGPADAQGLAALHVAVPPAAVAPHGVVHQRNGTARGEAIIGEKVYITFKTLLRQEGVDVGVAKIVTIPRLPPEALKNQVSGHGPSRALAQSSGEARSKVKATGRARSNYDIHLSGLVTLSGFQQLKEESPNAGGQTSGGGLGRGHIFNITPAEGEDFGGPEPAKPKN